MPPKKDRGTPCFFIQTAVGNIVMRLNRPDTGAGTVLTLHQIVAMHAPVKEIPYFDPVAFKKFYGSSGMAKTVAYNRLVENKRDEKALLEYIV
jgi:hypothetical protein